VDCAQRRTDPAKEKLELEAVLALENLEPMRTQSFQINYAKAAEIAASLMAGGTGRQLRPHPELGVAA
jgi:type II secretory pathway component HofQ